MADDKMRERLNERIASSAEGIQSMKLLCDTRNWGTGHAMVHKYDHMNVVLYFPVIIR